MSENLVEVQAGRSLFTQGEEGDCAYMIKEGEISIWTRTENGGDVELAVLHSGNLVGEMALIDGGPRTASARAVTDSVLIRIPKAHFSRLLDSADPTINLLIKVVLRRYRDMKERYDQLTTGALPDKVLDSIPGNDLELIHQASLAVDRVVREQELRKALENNYLEMYYQPIYDMESKSYVGCEALIRWNDPIQGVIQPDAFVGLAEETGLIEEIGFQVFKDASDAAKEFREALGGDSTFYVSVNLSSRQIETDAQVERLFDFFTVEGIDLNQLKIEITESLLMTDQSRVAVILERFRRSGAQISLDDFGTGYSSFSYLHQFPIDYIKIDKSFVFSMSKNAKSEAIVRSLCTLATSLNMQTIAEGVETAEDAALLDSFGSDFTQGYLYSKPVPKAEFLALIRKS